MTFTSRSIRGTGLSGERNGLPAGSRAGGREDPHVGRLAEHPHAVWPATAGPFRGQLSATGERVRVASDWTAHEKLALGSLGEPVLPLYNPLRT